MPAPGSEIPSSEPVDFVTAISRARVPPGRARAMRAYRPSVSETDFTKRDEDGTRGWISKTKQLTLTEVNRVLTEAMSFCGANFLTRELVFNAVELANEGIRHEFAP